MSIVSLTRQTWDSISGIPEIFQGRSNLLTRTGVTEFDVYTLVRNGLLAVMPSGLSSWIYSVRWRARVFVPSFNPAKYKQFAGGRTRYNIGQIQYGYPDGTSDYEDWLYPLQGCKYKGFTLNSANARESINMLTAPVGSPVTVDNVELFDGSFFSTGEPAINMGDKFHADTLILRTNFDVEYQLQIRYAGICTLARQAPSAFASLV